MTTFKVVPFGRQSHGQLTVIAAQHSSPPVNIVLPLSPRRLTAEKTRRQLTGTAEIARSRNLSTQCQQSGAIARCGSAWPKGVAVDSPRRAAGSEDQGTNSPREITAQPQPETRRANSNPR
jgi:hypothetical protein